MILFKNVIFNKGKVSATPIEYKGIIPLAKGGSAPTQTVTQTTAPWAQQAPYLHSGFNVASLLINNPDLYYPGQTYANFSPQTEQALNLTEQRALQGSPVQRSANNELQRTLGGEYLHGGKGFNAAYQAAANKIIPDVESRFSQHGRLNSGLARQAETSALADAFASQYANERQNQLRSMLFAPEAAQSDYNDLRALAGVGAQREGQTQSALDEAVARYDQNKNQGWQNLARYMGAIGGNYGQTAATTNTGFKGNRGAGILGGALGGAKIGSMIDPTGLIGPSVGGGIGGLLSLL